MKCRGNQGPYRLVMAETWKVATALEVGWERCIAGHAKWKCTVLGGL